VRLKAIQTPLSSGIGLIQAILSLSLDRWSATAGR